jgi:hypothetical protein
MEHAGNLVHLAKDDNAEDEYLEFRAVDVPHLIRDKQIGANFSSLATKRTGAAAKLASASWNGQKPFRWS